MTTERMRAGQVVRLRVNPKDCQSVLDVLNKAGVYTQGMSYAQCVSLALSTLLETARVTKMIPEPDPFQFLPRMEPFFGNSHHRKKLAIAETIGGIGEKFHAPSLVSDQPAETHEEPAPVVSAETLRRRRRLGELVNKKDLVEQGVAGVTWSEEDETEFNELYKEVYGE